MSAPLMLGVSGLRGIVGESLTPEVAARFARAFGAWLMRRGRRFERHAVWPKGPVVVVGADGRAGFEPIRDAVLSGLRDAGCCAEDHGVVMTPTVGVLMDAHDADGGLVVTASHNPQEWNGVKCLVRAEVGLSGGQQISACAPSAKLAAQIIELFTAGAPPAGEGRIVAMNGQGVGEHLGPVLSGAGERPGEGPVTQRRFRVTLDSVNGAGRLPGRALLEALNCELVHLGNEAGGMFPHLPEPLRENLTGLCEAVRSGGSDVGFAQDPDADRLAIVDERGEYIGEEYTLVLAAESLLGAPTPRAGSSPLPAAERPATQPVVVTNLSTSRMIEDVASRHGARVIRTAVGEANVVEAMKREKAAGAEVALGGEGNGGVIWPRVTYVRDSLSGMALVLALMARTGKTVSQLVAEIPRYAIEKRKVALARREDAAPVVEKIAREYAAERVDRQDGVRVDWDSRKAWLHVRASNTEPIMRLIAEAPTAAEARGILVEAERVIGG